jgi:sugar lactone lactonase YvrE
MAEVLLTGLGLGEHPRWYEDRLWFTDMATNLVSTVDLDGRSETVAEVPSMPMGLGWLPGALSGAAAHRRGAAAAPDLAQGRLLIVSSGDGKLLRREPDGTMTTHADLSGLSGFPWGDMVVDGRGNAYVGNIGFEFGEGEPAPGLVALVTSDGTVRQVADDVQFPNGMAITPDGATLILAESYGNRLTGFDIDADGTLTNRRVWADLPGGFPDGICLDAEGAIWYADVPNQRCVRVREGGEVLQTVELDRGCFACALGGPDRRTLFLVASAWPPSDTPQGQILTVEVSVPGAGWP